VCGKGSSSSSRAHSSSMTHVQQQKQQDTHVAVAQLAKRGRRAHAGGGGGVHIKQCPGKSSKRQHMQQQYADTQVPLAVVCALDAPASSSARTCIVCQFSIFYLIFFLRFFFRAMLFCAYIICDLVGAMRRSYCIAVAAAVRFSSR
jgi:hypothetical protein